MPRGVEGVKNGEGVSRQDLVSHTLPLIQPLEDKRERYDEIATVLGFEFNVHKSGVVPVGKRK